VSLFRERDRTLIVGDAFVTTRQESLFYALTQAIEMHGPPAYYTPDWGTAWESVELLAGLKPEIVSTGHGRPMRGAGMRIELQHLASEFGRRAVPPQGRYVDRPPVDAEAIYATPGRRSAIAAAAMGLAAVMAGALLLRARR
jgi:glyoxylase-like metal-dependent hydrolase (beta-lactamase superfamily II)